MSGRASGDRAPKGTGPGRISPAANAPALAKNAARAGRGLMAIAPVRETANGTALVPGSVLRADLEVPAG
jgi:hypothetical protein